MPDNALKAKMIYGYFNLLYYILEAYKPTLEKGTDIFINGFNLEQEDVKKSDQYVEKTTNKSIDDIIRVSPYLYSKFDSIIQVYKKYDFCIF